MIPKQAAGGSNKLALVSKMGTHPFIDSGHVVPYLRTWKGLKGVDAVVLRCGGSSYSGYRFYATMEDRVGNIFYKLMLGIIMMVLALSCYGYFGKKLLQPLSKKQRYRDKVFRDITNHKSVITYIGKNIEICFHSHQISSPKHRSTPLAFEEFLNDKGNQAKKLKFYINGSKAQGYVYAEFETTEAGEEYRYLIVDLLGYDFRLYLIPFVDPEEVIKSKQPKRKKRFKFF
eukprot:TRINITY_DN4260_c0_g1_i1.p1 TRINITY_DN4260_c0_g1~~TRINITY_DN4260_c0_g1_i1.p1  ORF type:complete len:246 (-),score=38.92 TRINITY_DN4260_c0_g1_i1:296-985(-)